MMTATFKINNGDPLDVEAYGVELLSYTQANQAEGQIQLTVLRRPDEPFLFTLNDSVAIYINGVRFFTGLADQGTVLASSTDYRHAHILHDPWRVVENCQWRWVESAANFPGRECNSSGVWHILRQWQAENLGEYFTMPTWPQSLPQTTYGRWYAQDAPGPLAPHITGLLKSSILAGQSWDYSNPVPAMVIRNHRDFVLDLEKEKNGVGDDIVLTRRDDLKPTCMELAHYSEAQGMYNGLVGIHAAWDEPAYLYPPATTPGLKVGGYGSVLAAIGEYQMGRAQVQAGAARFMYELLSVPLWEGTFTVQTYLDAADGASPLRLAPGMTVNLKGEGYRADWASMNAVIQAVEMDMKSGKATVHLGANGHASLTDVMERARDLLDMRFYDNMLPTPIVGSGPLTATPGPACGTGASATVFGEFYGPGATPLSIVISAQMGSSGFATAAGSVFVEVQFPDPMGGYTLADTYHTANETNAKALALLANITLVGNTLRITKATNAPVPDGYYQWNVTMNWPLPH